MPAVPRHVAINADDLPRAKAFYEAVFEWDVAPWGPPDFYQVGAPGAAPFGALQARHELIEGQRTTACRVTFGVDDIRDTLRRVQAHGGRVLMQPHLIEGVGEIGYFEDTEGNVIGVGQYLNPRRW